MATIEKRIGKDGSISYRVKVRIKGHPPQTASFERKTDANRWAQQIEADIRRGRYVPTTQARKRTVSDMIDRYLKEVLPIKPKNKSAWLVEQQLEWWRGEIGDFHVAEVTPDVIADCKSRLSNRVNRYGQRFSGGTVNRYFAAMSGVFKVAVKEWRWLERSPFEGVSRREESKGRVRFLSDEERKALLDACQESRTKALYPIVVLALATGMRKGEILGLTWSDVDLKRGMVVLRDTKNGDTRPVPLVGHAKKVMMEWSKVRRLGCTLVFPGKTPTKPINFNEAWFSALKRAGIEDFHFHDLRHTCASYLAMNGATPGEIAAVLGHKTLQMVKRYAHLSEQHVAGVLERMNTKVFGR